MVAKYELLQETFIAPIHYPAGTKMEYIGEPGPHMRPLNEEAEETLRAYYVKKPGASLNPVEQLPIQLDAPPPPQVLSVEAPTPPGRVLGVQEIADGMGAIRSFADQQVAGSAPVVAPDAALKAALEKETAEKLDPKGKSAQ